jgi:ECF transporter S component (folate family)
MEKNSVLSGAYWRAAAGELKSLRRLVFAALCCALSIVVGALYVVVGDNLRVYFTFFITAVGCAVYGPVMGVLVAAVTDTLNFILFPSGPYFPGYLLSEMVAGLIYGLFLYRRKITVLRLFGAKFLVNYLVNVTMGSLWSQILYGKGYLYYLVKSLIKNSLLLPLEVIALAALFAVLVPAFSRLGLLMAHEKRDLRKLALSSSAFTVFGLDCLLAGGCSYYYSTTLETGNIIFQGLAVGLAVIGLVLLITGPLLRRSRENPQA